jgi:feruloyl-CoA synthase
VIGNPVPGTELKLVPQRDAEGKLEIRVRGPNVSPGYWKEPALTARSFDDEGFYLIGDAVRFFDATNPAAGLVFDGRLAEDFKLATGTRVHVGSLRMRGIAALAPLAQDIVVTGHDRDACGFLVFPNVAACRAAAGLANPDAAAAAGSTSDTATLIAHPIVREQIRRGLRALRDEGGGSSMFAPRALLLAEPPSIDAGEITDKGYINQRAVRERRASLIDALHADPPGGQVIMA